MSIFSSSTSSSALNDNNNSAPIRCQICANSTDPQIPPEAQLIPGAQLFNHVADHFHYRPHQCKLCGFATNKSEELVQHGQQTQHHQHIQLFSTRNAFVEEFLNVLVEECKRRNTQNMPGVIVACSSIKNRELTHQQICVPSPQSVSPIPSLTPRELQQQQQQCQQQQCQQEQQCSTSITSIDFHNNDNQLSAGASAALLQLKSRLATIASAAEHLEHGDNCVEKTNQIFASGANDAMVNGDSFPNIAMAMRMPVLSPSVPAVINEKPEPVNVPLVLLASKLPLKCLLCGKITLNYTAREYHCNIHLGLALYRCRICSQLFKHYVGWRNHLEQAHRIKNPYQQQGMVHRIKENSERVKREAKRMYGPVRNAAPIRAKQHMDSAGGNAEGERGPDMITKRTNTAPIRSTPTTVTSTTASTAVSSIKPEYEDGNRPQQTKNNGVKEKKKWKMVSKVECVECGQLVPDSTLYCLNHINSWHLRLWLYQCGVCRADYTSTINAYSHCKNHIKAVHRGHGVEAVLKAPDFEQKMREIRAQYARFFGKFSSSD